EALGPGEDVEHVRVEVDPADFSAVPAVELVGGPGGVRAFVDEDAIVNDDLREAGDASAGDGLRDGVEQVVGRHRRIEGLEQVRIAEGGVASAEDDEAVAGELDLGAEGEVRPER